ncbi:hypothetical protein GOV12_00195 [Candidatus Pacearchaeota archaeon]|nr:hypothetical protein [Candidatus Pacearchaeota archaeon]
MENQPGNDGKDLSEDLLAVPVVEVVGALFQYAINEARRESGDLPLKEHVIRFPKRVEPEYVGDVIDHALSVYERETSTNEHDDPTLYRALSRATPSCSYQDALEDMTEVGRGIKAGDITFFCGDGGELYSVKN